MPSVRMLFRIAVRSAEAWLIADAEAISGYLGIDQSLIPSSPELLSNPKSTFVDLARRSTRRDIREDLIPFPGTTSRVGPAYVSRLEEFVKDHWRPPVAAARAESLSRCIASLESLRRKKRLAGPQPPHPRH